MNRNADIRQEIINVQRLQTALGDIPANPIPVIEVNPKLVKDLKTANLSKNTSGATAIMTTSNSKDTLLYGCNLNMIKDSTCDMATGNVFLSITQNGKTFALISLPVITLTAQSAGDRIMFNKPIKVDRNSAINISASGTYTVGVCNRTGVIFYTEEDNLKDGN